MTSRINTMLSIPMLYCMVAQNSPALIRERVRFRSEDQACSCLVVHPAAAARRLGQKAAGPAAWR